MEVKLRHGGLGGVPNFERWEKRLLGAKTVKHFVSYSSNLIQSNQNL